MSTIRYRPVPAARLFNPTRRYSQINWASFPEVVREFNRQLRAWYIAPARVLMARSGHYSFSALSITCTLIDTLSQYYYGKEESSQRVFVRFCRTQFPALRRRIHPAIRYVRRRQIRRLDDMAEVLYTGIRCGVVHEAHPALYTAISGTGRIAIFRKDGFTELSQNGGACVPCPTVIFDPGPLLRAVTQWLRAYLAGLQGAAPANQRLRRRFARKFRVSFGIQV